MRSAVGQSSQHGVGHLTDEFRRHARSHWHSTELPTHYLEESPMVITMSLGTAIPAAPARMAPASPARPSVPTTRSVASLEAALRDIRRLGGAVTSETRNVPGIGSWAFVADANGVELVIWQDAPAS